MEEQVTRLVNKVWDRYQQTPASQRLLIAISGIPGSGKTTLASLVTRRLNAIALDSTPAITATAPVAAFIPMDGYHLSRAQLSALPDPTTAHARRGAEFTFDGHSFLSLVKKLRAPLLPETVTIYAPSFNHAIKDPVQDDIAISSSARICVFEGNYVTLNKAPWREAASMMDELWFVDVDEDVARRRLVERHVRTGVTETAEEAENRVNENDLPNGRIITGNKVPGITEVVSSQEDESWEGEGAAVLGQGQGQEPRKRELEEAKKVVDGHLGI
ncbi:MAG: hypothetical protein MMC33_002746 [Icmadophila ericetorum]|nr:hypothetical protein [Icmadophila ericetorum]